jgi:hypothetical protein
MRPKKAHKSFALYRKETRAGPVWYARFWDGNTLRYALTRSTGILAEGKRQRRYEAEQAAREMLPSISFAPSVPEKPFIRYVADFWPPDSPYVKECALVKKKPLAAAYVTMNHENVRRHIAPFPGLQDVTLRGLSAGLIRDWITWAADKGVSGRIINLVLQGMRIPVRYAVVREAISHDPFRNIKNAPETPREKGLLRKSPGLLRHPRETRAPGLRFCWAFFAVCAAEKSGACNGEDGADHREAHRPQGFGEILTNDGGTRAPVRSGTAPEGRVTA